MSMSSIVHLKNVFLIPSNNHKLIKTEKLSYSRSLNPNLIISSEETDRKCKYAHTI